jgi:MFS family permease
MSQGRKDVQAESRNKGLVAGAVTAGAVTLGVIGAPILAGVAAVPAAVLAWRWWKHRAENGIKF